MVFEKREAPQKLAIFWITKEEASDPAFMDALKPEFKKWKENGYRPIVFESGTEDLEEGIRELMRRNYERKAKEELKAEKA